MPAASITSKLRSLFRAPRIVVLVVLVHLLVSGCRHRPDEAPGDPLPTPPPSANERFEDDEAGVPFAYAARDGLRLGLLDKDGVEITRTVDLPSRPISLAQTGDDELALLTRNHDDHFQLFVFDGSTLEERGHS